MIPKPEYPLSLAPIIAQESVVQHDLLLGVATVVTLLGMWLCWSVNRRNV